MQARIREHSMKMAEQGKKKHQKQESFVNADDNETV
jgi:hypothetical protein